MSAWTRINAVIDVDFGEVNDWEIRDFLDSRKDDGYMLAYDGKKKGKGFEITGSELNAVVVAEPLRNHVMDGRDRYYHGQRWSITVQGSLRDREFEETLAEWKKFAWKLAWFVYHDCRKLSGRGYFDNTVHFAEINYYNVDIVGQGKRYHRCSIKDGNQDDLW